MARGAGILSKAPNAPNVWVDTNIPYVILSLEAEEKNLDGITVASMRRGFQKAAAQVKKDYREIKRTLEPLRASTIARKGHSKMLYESGKLDASIMAIKPHVYKQGSKIVGELIWNIPNNDEGFPYALIHITGSRKGLPPRDYLSGAINKAHAEIPTLIKDGQGGGTSSVKFITTPGAGIAGAKPRGVPAGAAHIGDDLANGLDQFVWNFNYTNKIIPANDERMLPDYDMTKEFKPRGRDIITISLPPNASYAYIGAFGDVSTFVKGSFTSKIFLAWMFGWARGMFGISKRVQKRKLRHTLYENTERNRQKQKRKTADMRKVSYMKYK